MKKSSLKSSTILLVLSMGIILSALPSCKSLESVESVTSKVESQDSSALFNIVYSVDTIYQHDSIYIREIQRGDTIYLTRTEWRDRWRIREVHDTIHNTEYVTQTEYRDRVVGKPPEKYIPKFYKWCAGLLAGVLIILIIIITLKIRNRILIKRSSS